MTHLLYTGDPEIGYAHTPPAGSYRWMLTLPDNPTLDEVRAAFTHGSGRESPELDQREMRSFGVGDVVAQDGHYFLRWPLGWMELTDPEFIGVLAARVGREDQ